MSAGRKTEPFAYSRGSGKEWQPRARRAAQIARQLEDRILGGEWLVGFHIGREAELATEMSVSRWTLREAVRILEAAGLVSNRKGVGGGLFVASSAHAFVCKKVANYFEFIRVSGEEFGTTHQALGRLAMTTAIHNLTAEERSDVEAHLAEAPDPSMARKLVEVGYIHHLLVRASRNPALVLFAGVFSRLTFDASIYSDLDDATWRRTFERMAVFIEGMARAALAGDLAGAQDGHDGFALICREIYEASLTYLGKPITAAATQRAYDYFPPARPMKKADLVERQIREMIWERGWPVGTSLGSEKELLDRFNVGRAVLREALRSLEQLGVVEMGRGSRSGLRVISPDPEVAMDSCRRQLRRDRMSKTNALAVRRMLKDLASDGDDGRPIVTLIERAIAS